MIMIDWKRKLTSRKFWLAIIGFVTQLLILYGAPESEISQITACIMAGATLIAYIIGEGLADSGTNHNVFLPPEFEDEEDGEE